MNTLILLLTAAHAAPPGVGDLVFTEIHARASPSNCEWFEVANAAGVELELDGCSIAWQSDTSRRGELSGVLAAARTAANPAVLGRDTASCKVDEGAPIACVAWAEPERLTCVAPVDLPVAGISVTDSATGTLCLACGEPTNPDLPCDSADLALTVLDAVAFNWDDDFDGLCTVDADSGRCSAQHDLDPSSAEANDDLESWCVTEADSGTEFYSFDGRVIVGSPGEQNVCPVPAPTCAAGDLAITEVMSRPQSSTDSWLEITASGSLSEPCSLAGCLLSDIGPSTDRAVTLGVGVELQPGEIKLFAQGGGPTLDQAGTLPAVGVSGLYIGNAGDVTTLSLTCDGAVVDQVPVSEDFVDQRCPDKGCSAQVRDGASPSAEDPDAAFCVAPITAETTTVSAKSTADNDYRIVGTPGRATDCAAFDWPAEGELVITEITADGAGSVPDWFEVHNPTDRDLELQWCELRQADADPADTADADAYELAYRYFLADGAHNFGVKAGGYAVFSKGSCLDTEAEAAAADTALGSSDDVLTTCGDDGYRFGSVYIKADITSRLELVCEGTSIDTVTFNFDRMNVLEGHSIELRPDLVDVDGATSNDDWSNWCAAPFTGSSYESGAGDANYGTPSAANECEAPPNLKGSGLGCLCSAAGGDTAPAGLAVLLGGLMGLVGRRRRR